MGYPCLRLNGAFFGSLDRRSKNLIVKLPVGRVNELIASGRGAVFAPNNRTFREWVTSPALDPEVWRALLQEAKVHATRG